MKEPEITFEVLDICLAYESGYGKGLDARACKNPYATSDSSQAWDYGYFTGYEKRNSQKGCQSS